MNPVFERLNEIIPIVKQNRITMNQLVDFQGLFNCLRTDPPMVSHLDQSPEKIECSVCVNEATREVRYITPSGKLATIFVCNECYFEDGLWEGRQIIKTTHL